MEYLATNGRRIIIIGQYSVNGSVQLTGFPEVWGSSLPYISNSSIPDTNRGLDWTGTANNSNISTATEISCITIHAIPANYMRIPVFSRVVRSRN